MYLDVCVGMDVIYYCIILLLLSWCYCFGYVDICDFALSLSICPSNVWTGGELEFL